MAHCVFSIDAGAVASTDGDHKALTKSRRIVRGTVAAVFVAGNGYHRPLDPVQMTRIAPAGAAGNVGVVGSAYRTVLRVAEKAPTTQAGTANGSPELRPPGHRVSARFDRGLTYLTAPQATR
jgi:hypothetical protein